MSGLRKALVGTVVALSLLGIGALAQPVDASSADVVVAGDRWCC